MKEEIDTQSQERLFVLTGNDKNATELVMKNLGTYLEQRPEVFQNDLLSNLAYTLGQRKSLHPWRVVVTAASSVELVEALSSGKISPAKQELDEPRLGWVFTGYVLQKLFRSEHLLIRPYWSQSRSSMVGYGTRVVLSLPCLCGSA